MAIAATALFVLLSCWWLSQDRAMPYGDAAEHLYIAFGFHDDLQRGAWLAPFTTQSVYAPLTRLVGALAIFVGGRTVAAPIVAENLIYVPLLAVGCYRTAELVFGRAAGPLAVIFALGAPLIAEQFHVFMIDAPLAALVAMTVWLVLASDGFRRVDVAAGAGLLTGLGLLSKQSFPLYVAGLVAIVAIDGRAWRRPRGLVAFALVAFAVAAPWYVEHLSSFGAFRSVAEGEPTVARLAKPALLSTANLGWYFWALASGLLFVPLLAFALAGVAKTAFAARPGARGQHRARQLLGGAALAWVAITAMPHHDVRYTEPLIVFLAVLGTGWIVRLRAAPRRTATALLLLAIAASTLGATFGVGPPSDALLPGNRNAPRGEGVPPLNHLTVYSNHNFMVSGPRSGGDVLGLLKDLRRRGVREVLWLEAQAPQGYVDFSANGLLTFALIAQLHIPSGAVQPALLDEQSAFLFRARRFGSARPCARLSGGHGLWIRLGDPWARGARDYCPRFTPRFYGP